MKTPLYFSAVAIACALAMGLTAGADELKPGDVAPEFKLPGTDGKTYDLQDLTKDQVVVLAWFPKAKTGGCTKECKSLKENGAAVRQFDVAYFTASCDTPAFNKEFSDELGLDYPILSDPGKKVAQAYGVVHGDRKVPERWTFFIGTDGKILAIDKAVKTETHATDIAAKLKELGVKEKK
jgi:peroxiredoxin Q/BCP